MIDTLFGMKVHVIETPVVPQGEIWIMHHPFEPDKKPFNPADILGKIVNIGNGG